MAKGRRDRRDWGSCSRSYSTAEGYKKIAAVPCNLAIWKRLWDYKSLPKIDLFIWTLVHRSVPTGENLENKGFVGPFWCPLCATASENIQHTFLIVHFPGACGSKWWRRGGTGFIFLAPFRSASPIGIRSIMKTWIRKKDLESVGWISQKLFAGASGLNEIIEFSMINPFQLGK